MRDRYYNRLFETRIKAWSDTNIGKWMKLLSKYGEITLNNISLNKINNSTNNKHIEVSSNELIIEIHIMAKNLILKVMERKSYISSMVLSHFHTLMKL